jgi:hypothetical protein
MTFRSALFLLFLCLISTPAICQAPPVAFSKVFGGNHDEHGQRIIQTSDKGFLILGNSNSTSGQVVGVIDSMSGQSDLWVAKTDSNGNFLWGKTVVGGSSTPWSIAELPQAYIIGGNSQGHTYDFANLPAGGDNNFIVWLSKTDGAVMLVRSYRGTLWNNFTYDLQQFDNNHFLAAGMINGQAWIAKINNVTGDTAWTAQYGGSLGEKFYSVRKVGPHIYGAGYASSTNGDVIGNPGGIHSWLVKMDTLGQLVWAKVYAGASDEFRSVDITPSGNILCGGNASGPGPFMHGYHAMMDYWVVKLNPDGDTIWAKCYGGNDHDYFNNLEATNDGGAILFGNTKSNNGDISSNTGIIDAWLVRIDSNGNILWEKTLGSNLADNTGSLVLTCDNGYAFTALASQVSKDVIGPGFGYFDMWVCKLSSDGLDNADCPVVAGTSQLATAEDEVIVYPNPAASQIQVSGSLNGGAFNVDITDLSGHIVYSAAQPDRNHKIDIGHLSPGVYFLTAHRDGSTLSQKLVVY